MTLRAFQKKSRRPEQRIRAIAGFDLPRDSRDALRLREEFDPHLRSPHHWRCRRTIPFLLLPKRTPASATISPAPLIAPPAFRRTTRTRPAFVIAPTRTRWPVATRPAIISIPAWRPAAALAAIAARAIAGVALVVGIAIRRRGFLHPVGEKFQVKFDRRIAHWNRVTPFSEDCK